MLLSVPVLERPSYALGTYEPKVVEAISANVGPGAIAFDIGSHVGYLSLVLSKKVCAEGRVVSFEPDVRNLRALRTNVEQNLISNVTIVDQPLSNKPGTIKFAIYDTYSLVNHVVDSFHDSASDAQIVEVEATSVDAYCNDNDLRPTFLKIDVEGHEVSVLQGAMGLLRAQHPTVLVEVRPDTFIAVSALLKPLGYKHKMLGGNGRGLESNCIDDVLYTWHNP